MIKLTHGKKKHAVYIAAEHVTYLTVDAGLTQVYTVDSAFMPTPVLEDIEDVAELVRYNKQFNFENGIRTAVYDAMNAIHREQVAAMYGESQPPIATEEDTHTEGDGEE